jgi:PAS domain S-box-containing protein
LGAILAVTVFGFALFLYLSGLVRAQRAQLAAADAMVRASRAEKEKELEQRFHALVEASSVGQLVVDDGGTIVIANRAIEELLGYAPADLIGQPVETLLPEDLREHHVALRDEYLASPEARKMGNGRIFSARHKDGSPVQVEVGLNPYSENGQQHVLVNVVGVSAP